MNAVTDDAMRNVVEARDPAHPDRVVGVTTLMAAAELEEAVTAAAASQPSWAADASARAEALMRWSLALEANREAIAELVVQEVGKPISEARAEVDRGVRILRYYSQAALDSDGQTYPAAPGSRLLAERRPIGTALLITPWNFPVAIPLWKMAPGLAFGNAVLLRPSSASALTARRIAELAVDFIPHGVVNVIPCHSHAVHPLLDDQRIAGVSFTGSTAVGRDIVSRVVSRGGVAQAEMGGQNAAIVLDDADLDEATQMIADAAMRFAGQKCTATSRVIVEQSIADRFRDLLVDRIAALPVGDPTAPATAVGPLISSTARDEVDGSVRRAVARGNRLITGGGRPPVEGWFYEPTLVAVDASSDPFAQAETFGPAASIQVVASPAEAIAVANDSRYGLSGAVYGVDAGRAEAVARQLRVGMVRVNAPTVGIDYYAPFGGYGDSSYGPREQGRAAREFFTTTRTIFVAGPGPT